MNNLNDPNPKDSEERLDPATVRRIWDLAQALAPAFNEALDQLDAGAGEVKFNPNQALNPLARATGCPWQHSIEGTYGKTKLEDVSGKLHTIRDDRLFHQVVGSLYLCDNCKFLEGNFRLAGVDPKTVVPGTIRTELINGGVNTSYVYRTSAEFASAGEHSFILLVAVEPIGSMAQQILFSQFRNLAFFYYDSPQPNYLPDLPVGVDQKPRPYKPPELVRPYLEAISELNGRQMYISSTEDRLGYDELNRIGRRFGFNNDDKPMTDAAETDRLSCEIVRALTQLYASTYDSQKRIGYSPAIYLNNGEIICRPGSLADPKIAICAPTECKPSLSGDFVRLLLTTSDPSVRAPAGIVFNPQPSRLDALRTSLIRGLEPRFGAEAPELALSFLKEFTQRPGCQRAVPPAFVAAIESL